MKISEKIARYFLGFWFLVGAIEGWLGIVFDIYWFDLEKFSYFLKCIMDTSYFWIFLKIVQTIGAISLLFNYRPALGLLVVTPVTAIICLFYFFELFIFSPVAVALIIATAVLFYAYKEKYSLILESK
jgi:hypothetical protein